MDSFLDYFQDLGDHRAYRPHEWLVKFRNPFGEYGQWNFEPTFISNELEFYVVACLTFIHAYRHGSRYMWLWWTTVAHGLMVELVSYWVEPIDNFWHAQSTFMLFGQREPLHIICLYPAFIYPAFVAVMRLGVSELTEACAMGLFVVLFDMPYDIMGIKLLWWTWHDTDANIRDRHYWVPWTSYYFHMTFACAFNLIYNRTRRYFVGLSGTYSTDELRRMPYAQQLVAQNWWGEFKALLVTGMCSMPFGIVQFVPGYHLFKDVFGIHAEVTVTGLAGIYSIVLMYGMQRSKPTQTLEHGRREEGRGDKKLGAGKWYLDECYLGILIHFIHYMVLVVVAKPSSYQVQGMHQPQGTPIGSGEPFDCSLTRNLSYPYPFTSAAFPPFLQGDLPDVSVWKRPYICESGELLDEKIFNFECDKASEQPWQGGHQWFWICGTDWTNQGTGTSHVEYILVIWLVCIFGILIYSNAYCYPRNFFEQFFVLKEFPKYYKTNNPQDNIVAVEGVRVSDNGDKEYKVKKATPDGRVVTYWESQESLVMDSAGPQYGERHGMYGLFYDSYGGSTRDRLKTFDSHQHALERLKLYNDRNKRRPVVGISYAGARPEVASMDGEEE